MIKEFKTFLEKHIKEKEKCSVLMAVSGGIDSMVMADLFMKEGIKVAAAHCNFSLRGEESDRDELFVREYSEKNRIPFHAVRFDTLRFAKQNGLSIQMAARELRYNWFENVRSENRYDYVAVAHNLSDNIETILVNLTRGTGLSGLTGMKPVNGSIIRPLLNVTRSEIEEYGLINKVDYREDRSNAETKYSRNKIRHKVIPVLKEINPDAENAIAATIARLSQTDELVAGYIDSIKKKLSCDNDPYTSYNIKKLTDLSANDSMLFELFQNFGLNSNQITDLQNIIKGRTGGQLHTPTHRILKDRTRLIIAPATVNKSTFLNISNKSGFAEVPVIRSVKSVKNTGKLKLIGERNTAFLDESKIIFPLIIRNWREGDFFYPFGMKHRKKVSDYLIDRKISLADKEKILILETAGKIAWILGERIDDRFRVGPGTERVLILRSGF